MGSDPRKLMGPSQTNDAAEGVVGVGGREPCRIGHRREAAARIRLLDARAVGLDDERLLPEVVAGGRRPRDARVLAGRRADILDHWMILYQRSSVKLRQQYH